MEIQSNLPLSETTFYILLTLAPSPKHGYIIMKDVHALSKGRITLSTGTLYGALKRLLEAGWIEPIREHDLPSGTRPRRAYTLSALGRSILAAETTRLKSLVQAARSYTAKGRV